MRFFLAVANGPLRDPDPLGDLLSDVGSIVTSVLGWVGNVASVITSTPLLYLSLGFFVIGGVCGLIGRMLSKN